MARLALRQRQTVENACGLLGFRRRSPASAGCGATGTTSVDLGQIKSGPRSLRAREPRFRPCPLRSLRAALAKGAGSASPRTARLLRLGIRSLRSLTPKTGFSRARSGDQTLRWTVKLSPLEFGPDRRLGAGASPPTVCLRETTGPWAGLLPCSLRSPRQVGRPCPWFRLASGGSPQVTGTCAKRGGPAGRNSRPAAPRFACAG